jgi:hypothetical protein
MTTFRSERLGRRPCAPHRRKAATARRGVFAITGVVYVINSEGVGAIGRSRTRSVTSSVPGASALACPD